MYLLSTTISPDDVEIILDRTICGILYFLNIIRVAVFSRHCRGITMVFWEKNNSGTSGLIFEESDQLFFVISCFSQCK